MKISPNDLQKNEMKNQNQNQVINLKKSRYLHNETANCLQPNRIPSRNFRIGSYTKRAQMVTYLLQNKNSLLYTDFNTNKKPHKKHP